jgi:acyl-CoA synthetase (AMP-forming)/AMP-acid ligase II
MPQQSDRTASSSVILVVRRPQSLACGDPCGAPGIDPVAQPGSEAMTPLTVRCDPQLPNKMRQREHRDEATGVLPATFLNEAIRHHPDRRATGTLIAGASAVLRERFSASAWLQDIRHFRVTATNMLGIVAAFVVATPPSESDRDHQLRVICNVPNTPEHDRIFRDPFGVKEVIGAFGMTEVNIPLYGAYGRPHAGTCGRVYDRYFEVEIRDPDNDQLLPRGTVGEIMVRPKAAFGFMAGYRDMPERTVVAWRNLWFHTGDAGVMAEDGYVTYVDRIKDCIRRRGENISSFEVELAISRLQGVAEVAAYAAVPSSVVWRSLV